MLPIKRLSEYFSPVMLLPSLLFILPFFAGRPFLSGVTSFVPMAIAVLLFTAAGAFIVYRSERTPSTRPYALSLGVFFLCLLSAFFSVNPFLSRAALQLLLAGLVVFHAARAIAGREEALHLMLEAIGFSASFLALYALFYGYNIGQLSELRATFFNYNAFAGYLAPAALFLPVLALLDDGSQRSRSVFFFPLLGTLSLYFAWIAVDIGQWLPWLLIIVCFALLGYILLRHLSRRAVYLLFSLPAPLVLLMTGSRGGLLAMAAAALVILLLAGWREARLRRALQWALPVFALAMGALLLLDPVLLQRFGLIFDPANRSNLFRLLAWKGSWAAFRAAPFLGHGPGTFISFYPHFKLGGADTMMAHNSYLQAAAETGIAGMAAAVAFILYAILRPLRHRQEGGADNPGRRLPMAALAGGLAALAVHNMVDYTLYMPAHLLTGMALLGALCGSVPQEGEKERRRLLSGRSFRMVLLVMSALSLLSVIYPALPAAVKYENGLEAMQKGWKACGLEEIDAAVRLDSVSGKYAVTLAELCASNAAESPEAADRAGKLYALAVRNDPLNPYYRLRWAEFLQMKGRHDEAIAKAREAISLCDSTRAAYRIIGDIKRSQGQIQAAESAYLAGLSIDDRQYESDAWLPLGELLPQMESGKSHLGLGEIYASSGRNAEAVRELKAARDIFAGFVKKVEENRLLWDRKPEAEAYKNIIADIDMRLHGLSVL